MEVKYDPVNLFERHIFLSAVVSWHHSSAVGARIAAQPGIQLEEQFSACVELSGVPCEFYCA